jgi:hypothetical protein
MIENHLLACAKQVPSLNYNERPNDKVSLVVIHNISLPPKQFGGDCVEQFFTNQLDFGTHPILFASSAAFILFYFAPVKCIAWVSFPARGNIAVANNIRY